MRAVSKSARKGWRGALFKFTVRPIPKKIGTRKRSSLAFQKVCRARARLGDLKS